MLQSENIRKSKDNLYIINDKNIYNFSYER